MTDREFDPSVVDRLKRQTNDIFANVATPPQKGGTPGSNMSISMGSLTPDSLSTGKKSINCKIRDNINLIVLGLT
jgi:hypothetical protein